MIDVKSRKQDAPSAGAQVTAVNLAWKRKGEDFVELGLPIQPVIVDTQGNVKWQAAAELDIHLDPAVKTNPRVTFFATGNVGGTYSPQDPDGKSRVVNATGAGFGLKVSF